MRKKKIVREFINSICPEMRVRFKRNSNYYESSNNTIYIDLKDTNDGGFMRHLRAVHDYDYAYCFSLLMWTILHELGHYFTQDKYEDSDEDLVTREVCALVPREVSDADPKIQDIYFNLKTEWVATEWAIEFVKSHLSFCIAYSGLLD